MESHIDSTGLPPGSDPFDSNWRYTIRFSKVATEGPVAAHLREVGASLGYSSRRARMRSTVDQTAELVTAMSQSIGEMQEISAVLSRQTEELSASVDAFVQMIRA